MSGQSPFIQRLLFTHSLAPHSDVLIPSTGPAIAWSFLALVESVLHLMPGWGYELTGQLSLPKYGQGFRISCWWAIVLSWMGPLAGGVRLIQVGSTMDYHSSPGRFPAQLSLVEIPGLSAFPPQWQRGNTWWGGSSSRTRMTRTRKVHLLVLTQISQGGRGNGKSSFSWGLTADTLSLIQGSPAVGNV